MSRQEFSKAVKLAAWERCGGRCECGCHLKIIGSPEYHHAVPAALGGDNSLDNCRVLDKKHHRQITAEKDIPEISKSDRIFEKRIGVRKSRHPMRKAPEGYNSWTRSWGRR